MINEVKDFGVIFVALGKGLPEKQNSLKILIMSWEMINTLKKEWL